MLFSYAYDTNFTKEGLRLIWICYSQPQKCSDSRESIANEISRYEFSGVASRYNNIAHPFPHEPKHSVTIPTRSNHPTLMQAQKIMVF